ncbi:MAG: response regulator [Bacteroidia bacterium]|nr:response regulator [Bacteroidia bacterium]
MKEILAVDDNVVDNLINEIVLKRAFPDHKVIVISDSSEALSYFKTNRTKLPSLIVLDINMPVVSGWDLLEELSSYDQETNVFMLTSSIFKEDEKRARTYSCLKGYFVKPLDEASAEQMRQVLDANKQTI